MVPLCAVRRTRARRLLAIPPDARHLLHALASSASEPTITASVGSGGFLNRAISAANTSSTVPLVGSPLLFVSNSSINGYALGARWYAWSPPKGPKSTVYL